VDRVYSAVDAREALATLASGDVRGKLVLTGF
jgi:hypothetical protein